MPQFYPNSAANYIATLMQTELAVSKLRLYQDELITPSIATTRAELVAAEATYTGYTATGLALTAWFAAIAAAIGGYSIDSPKVQFATAAPYTVPNNIGGFWVETAGGDLIVIGSFAEAEPMAGAGDGFPISVSLIFPN